MSEEQVGALTGWQTSNHSSGLKCALFEVTVGNLLKGVASDNTYFLYDAQCHMCDVCAKFVFESYRRDTEKKSVQKERGKKRTGNKKATQRVSGADNDD